MHETITTLQDTRIRRVIELHQGDVIHLRKTVDIPLLKLGDRYDFRTGAKIALYYKTSHSAQGIVIGIIKNPPLKKWYQFWIKQTVVGYQIQIL